MPAHWPPHCSLERLHQRAQLRRAVRSFFDNRNYLEVDTPLLSHDIVVDAHLDPFTVDVNNETLFLQTSPEASMKRLLAAGSGSIYQITRSFRGSEQGRLHNPEFTIVEWYAVGATLDDQITFTEELIRHSASLFPEVRLSERRFRITTYQDAFQTHVGVDPLGVSDEELIRRAVSTELDNIPQHRDDLLNLLLAEFVEPHLGNDGPEFLTDYPASQAALAQLGDKDPRAARRFELYVNGVELCNGYQELTAADELRERDRRENQRRRDRGADALPGAARMLAAMESGLPESSGVALGFDRLLMILSGQDRLSNVQPFPFERA